MKTSFAGIDGFDLLQILDTQVGAFVEAKKNAIPKQENPLYILQEGWTWLAAQGHLAITTSRWSQTNSWVPCRIQVGPEGTPIDITGSLNSAFSERLQFPNIQGKKDLNYLEVVQQVQTQGVNEHLQAEGILCRLKGFQHEATSSCATFLNALTALMFGVEASRNKATLATSLMMLDLISQQKCYGRSGKKPFMLSTAFHSSHNYCWDDPDEHWYGGKFPMAVHGTGPGNLKERYDGVDGDQSIRDEIKRDPRRHSVPRREVTLLIHWLEANALQDPTAQTVASAIFNRIQHGFYGNDAPWVLRGNPSTDTGRHREMEFDGKYYVTSYDRSGMPAMHKSRRCKLLPRSNEGVNSLLIAKQRDMNQYKKIYKPCRYCWDRTPGAPYS